jgi:hypothetical protein
MRWTRSMDIQPGTYRFVVISDDGVRVYVDGQPVINEWHDHPRRTYQAERYLAGGPHEIVVEYYEHTEVAAVAFSMTRTSTPQGEWLGEYYGNRWLGGAPAFTRSDPAIDFDWGYGSPGGGLPRDNFSVSWRRTIDFEPGSYRFTTTTDDGVRLWVGDQLLIDQWHDQPATSHAGAVYLSGAQPVRMEMYEHTGVAEARLQWTRLNDGQSGVVVVDDGDPGFVKGGTASAWRHVTGGRGGWFYWTWNNDRVRSGYNWVRWYPDVGPGRYEVSVFVPEGRVRTSAARYWVSHRGSYTLRRVDQSANGGRWVSLGTYWFDGTRKDYVSLADVTYEPYLSRSVAFDAVKWESR